MNWKDIEGYEGLYQVSDEGQVISLVIDSHRRGRILKPMKTHKGYLNVDLVDKDGVKKSFRIHRLVAQAFLPNPLNLPQVNHKNEDKTDNRVENLEWCDQSYNINYGTRNERASNKNREKQLNDKNRSKPVLQYSLDGTFIQEFPSTHEVKRQLGYNRGHISECCRGNTRLRTYKGFIWKFKTEKEVA